MNDTIECLVCNTAFSPKSPRAKFCSEACKQRNKREKIGVPENRVVAEIESPSKKEPSELINLLKECESYGCKVDWDNLKVWRSLTNSGEWIPPHACKHGPHLNPDCPERQNG